MAAAQDAPLSRKEISVLVLKSQLFQHWHWFRYHFNTLVTPDREHPLAASVLDALLTCDQRMPGYAEKFVGTLGAIGGQEKFIPHYEQLLQLLAELHIVYRVVSCPWSADARLLSEPTATGSKKNPEITVEDNDVIYGIEVKAPALLTHINARSTNRTQLPARVFTGDMLRAVRGDEEVATLPRDNPVKDFLISADAKFRAFKDHTPGFVGLLIIVWDDYIYEPISSLLHPSSGLFTPASFHKQPNNEPVTYPSVDGVVIVRHLHQLLRATRDEPLIDGCRHALDYGEDGSFPFKAFIANPHGGTVPEILLHCLQAHPPTAEMGAEYTPKDLVWWVPV